MAKPPIIDDTWTAFTAPVAPPHIRQFVQEDLPKAKPCHVTTGGYLRCPGCGAALQAHLDWHWQHLGLEKLATSPHFHHVKPIYSKSGTITGYAVPVRRCAFPDCLAVLVLTRSAPDYQVYHYLRRRKCRGWNFDRRILEDVVAS